MHDFEIYHVQLILHYLSITLIYGWKVATIEAIKFSPFIFHYGLCLCHLISYCLPRNNTMKFAVLSQEKINTTSTWREGKSVFSLTYFPINCTVWSSQMLGVTVVRSFYINNRYIVWCVLILMLSDHKSGLSLRYMCVLRGRDSSHEWRIRDSFLTGMFAHAIN